MAQKQQPTMQDLILYVGDTPQLPQERTTTWLLMGRGKLRLDSILQVYSLQLQQILAGFDGKSIVEKDKALTEYRKVHAEMVDKRRDFTQYFDMATGQCMLAEKQYDYKTNAEYVRCSNLELEERKKANDKQVELNNKATEIASYNSHIKNEYDRIFTKYKLDLSTWSHQTYTACLSAKTPVDSIPKAIGTCIEAFKAARPEAMTGFKRTLVTDEEAMNIFKSITPPNWEAAFNDAVVNLHTKFSMYPNDLAAADVVLAQINTQHSLQVSATLQESQNRQAAQTLTDQALSGDMFVGAEGLKPVTEQTKMVIEDDNPHWVLWILTAGAQHYAEVMKHVKVEKYGRLTLAQIAAALDKAMIKVSNVKYETTRK